MRAIRAERVELQQRIVEIEERRLAHVKSLVSAGRASEEDLADVEVKVLEARLRLLDAREHAAAALHAESHHGH